MSQAIQSDSNGTVSPVLSVLESVLVLELNFVSLTLKGRKATRYG